MAFILWEFEMTESLPCVMFFPMVYLVSTQKPKQSLNFSKGTPTSISGIAKIPLIFLL